MSRAGGPNGGHGRLADRLLVPLDLSRSSMSRPSRLAPVMPPGGWVSIAASVVLLLAQPIHRLVRIYTVICTVRDLLQVPIHKPRPPQPPRLGQLHL